MSASAYREMTPPELFEHYAGLSTEEQLGFMSKVIDSQRSASECFVRSHESQIVHLDREIATLAESEQKAVRRAARFEAELIQETLMRLQSDRAAAAAVAGREHESEGRVMFLQLWREAKGETR